MNKDGGRAGLLAPLFVCASELQRGAAPYGIVRHCDFAYNKKFNATFCLHGGSKPPPYT